HMNLPIFLLVLPMGLLPSTYFPLEHPALVALNLANPLYHLAQAFRGILIGGPAAGPPSGVAAPSPSPLWALAPLALPLLRRRRRPTGSPRPARPAPAAPPRPRRLSAAIARVRPRPMHSGATSGESNVSSCGLPVPR